MGFADGHPEGKRCAAIRCASMRTLFGYQELQIQSEAIAWQRQEGQW